MKTLKEELKNLRGARGRDEEIRWAIDELALRYGEDATGPWAVEMTEFHGGWRVSQHATAYRAVDRARRERVTDCICGCTVVTKV